VAVFVVGYSTGLAGEVLGSDFDTDLHCGVVVVAVVEVDQAAGFDTELGGVVVGEGQAAEYTTVVDNSKVLVLDMRIQLHGGNLTLAFLECFVVLESDGPSEVPSDSGKMELEAEMHTGLGGVQRLDWEQGSLFVAPTIWPLHRSSQPVHQW
jgi:hypothetical protein